MLLPSGKCRILSGVLEASLIKVDNFLKLASRAHFNFSQAGGDLPDCVIQAGTRL